jgi:hypothetical protein
VELLYDPAITLLDDYPMEMMAANETDTYLPMFIAVLFAMAKILNTVGVHEQTEWINQICFYTQWSIIKP